MRSVYMNDAATSFPKPDCVVDAVTEALRTCGNPGRGASAASLSPSRMVTSLREEIAAFFSFRDPSRVVFTCNITEALNLVLYGLLEPGDHVIATDLDHNSVLRPLYDLQAHRGVSVSFVPADRRGAVRYEDFERLMRDNTKAVVCTHASNLTGDVLDIGRIAKTAHTHHALFILDTAQTAGVLPISMEETGIDILCFTGHKSLMGPQGTGGLIVGEDVRLKPLIRGGTGIRSFEEDQPREYPEHLEAGTLNTPGLAGLLAAVRYVRDTGLSVIRAHEQELTTQFCDGVRGIPGITVYGSLGEEKDPGRSDRGYRDDRCTEDGSRATSAPAPLSSSQRGRDHMAIVALNMEGISSAELADVLAEDYGIQVRAGGHCAPRMHRALGTDRSGAVRFSFGWFTTAEEIDYAVRALAAIRKEL